MIVIKRQDCHYMYDQDDKPVAEWDRDIHEWIVLEHREEEFNNDGCCWYGFPGCQTREQYERTQQQLK